jgi:hypothetical protein
MRIDQPARDTIDVKGDSQVPRGTSTPIHPPHPRHCERSEARHCEERSTRHCEEQSDEAIQTSKTIKETQNDTRWSSIYYGK